MLNSNQLKNDIITNIQNETQFNLVHNRLANTIATYIKNNLEIFGIYVGVINSIPPVPDPFNGAYVFKLINCTINNAILSSSINGIQWYNMLIQQIQLGSIINIKDKLNIITLMNPMPIIMSIIPSVVNLKNIQFQMNWNIISNQIVKNMISAIPIVSLPAFSGAGGIGVVSFKNFY